MGTQGLRADQSVTAYLTVKNATAALDFYRKAFGAEEIYRLTDDNGLIGHAEFRIGTSVLMLSDEHPDFGALSPPTIGGSPVKFHILVEDADRAIARAVEAGATELRPAQDQFYGMRSGMVADPFGHSWFIGSPVEQVSADEMQRRYNCLLEGAKT
jgi:PhnB protein